LSNYFGFGIVFAQQLILMKLRKWLARIAKAAGVARAGRGGRVGVKEILFEIDREIAQLKQARALLKSGAPTNGFHIEGTKKHSRKKNRHLTPEGRKRIAEAQKRRWERERRAAAGK
jgi:hypothetical protein